MLRKSSKFSPNPCKKHLSCKMKNCTLCRLDTYTYYYCTHSKFGLACLFPVTTPLGNNKDSKHTYIHTCSCDTGKFTIIVTELKLDGKFAMWGIWASGFNISKRGSVTGSQEKFGREGTAIARTARATKQQQS